MQGSASSLGERTMCSFAIRRAAKGLAFICFHFDGRLTRGSRVLFQNLAFDHKKEKHKCSVACDEWQSFASHCWMYK